MSLPAFTYLHHAYSPFIPAKNWEDRYERRITKWAHENLPNERVMPSGTIRLWYDAWYDNIQVDGGADQGLLNQLVPAARYQIDQNDRGDLSVLWLQALGASAVIVPDTTSAEWYHDYKYPKKFQGLLPVIWDDGHGTTIYRVPRIHRDLARVVDRAKLAQVGELDFEYYEAALKSYVSLIEEPQPETSAIWSGFEALKLNVTVGQGQSVLLQETYDPAWHAYEGGKALPTRMDQTMQFTLIDVGPGTHTIDMRFETPLENRVGQAIFLFSLLCVLTLSLPPLLRRLR
jgi:hypothetical protein